MSAFKRWISLLLLSLTYKRHTLCRSCFVFGDKGFYGVIGSAKAKLDRECPQISEMLMTQKWIIWQPIGNKAALSLHVPLMGISEKWVDWGEEGAAAFIVYAVTLKRTTQSLPTKQLVESRRIAKNDTLTILRELGYPHELELCFDEA